MVRLFSLVFFMTSRSAIGALRWPQRAWSRRLFPHAISRVALLRSVDQYTQRRASCKQREVKSVCQSKTSPMVLPITSSVFWASPPTWRRAGLNTVRCLIGCTIGDFSMMWYLQAFYPAIGIGAVMAISSKPLFLRVPNSMVT